MKGANRVALRTLWRRVLAFSLLSCLTVPVLSQRYVFRSFRQAQGLNNLTITALAFDTQGFLWVGTQNGVYRFLGSGFQRFGKEQGLEERSVSAIVAAPDGTIWVGTEKNLYRWDGVDFRPATATPIRIGTPNAIASESAGTLLIVVGDQLERLSYTPQGGVSSFVPLFFNQLSAKDPRLGEAKLVKVAPDQSVWLACGRQLCRWKDGVLQNWGKDQGLREETHSTMVFDHKGSVWVAGEHHVLELPAGAGSFLDRTPAEFARHQDLFETFLAVDRFGRVLLSGAEGLQRWDGSAWRTFGVANGVEPGILSPIVFDAAGDLWIGTFGAGVQQWVGYENWEGWTDLQALPSSSIWSVEPRRATSVIVGTELGPATIDLHTGGVVPGSLAKRWTYGAVSTILSKPGGDTLFGTVNGDVLRRPAGSRSIQEVAPLKTFIYKFFRDLAGRTFVLNYRHGLLELKDTSAGLHTVELPEVTSLLDSKSPVYKACSTAAGTDWFSSRAGVLQLAENHWRKVPVDGLPEGNIPTLRGLTCAKDGSLWAYGKESGLWHLVPGHGRLVARELALPPAERSLSILDIFSDSRGWLWLATDDGLLVWNGQTWAHLDQEVGLIWNDLNQFNLNEDADGSLWMGTSGGVAHLIHVEQVFLHAPPTLALVEVRRDEALLPPSASLQMPWSRRDLSIQFAAAGTSNQNDQIFKYRIAGLQPAWTETRNATVHLQSLPPGKYVFEVYAQDQVSGVRSGVLSLPLRVFPPWWRTAWAYVFYLLCAALAIFVLFRLRMRQIFLQKQRLELLVVERTAELERSRQELYMQATHDSLTGLLNRAAILSAFEREYQRAQRERRALTVVLADIDHFKKVNDLHGHLAGDEALRRFSSVLSQSIRTYDHAGRYGGEEFMLILTGDSTASVRERINQLHENITNIEIDSDEKLFVITCSLGAICLELGSTSVDDRIILASVDEALYHAKNSGRNRAVLRTTYH